MPGLFDVQVLGSQTRVNIHWDNNGTITRVEPCGAPETARAAKAPAVWNPDVSAEPDGLWQGGGSLVLPPLVDIHTHLDKTGTVSDAHIRSATLSGAIEAYAALRKSSGPDQVYMRALQTARQCADYGTGVLRTHIDSYYPDQARLAGVLTALMAVKRDMADKMAIQLVLMCPTTVDPAWARGLCEIAPQLSALGGAPALAENPVENLRSIMSQALRYELPVDLHIDETLDPRVNTLELLAQEVLAQDFPFPVVAGHAVSLQSQSPPNQQRITQKVKEAGIHIVSLPQTNCYLQGRETEGQGLRGMTPLQTWNAAGMDVALASDNIQDPFHPWGNGDLLQMASLALYAGHLQEYDSTGVLRGISEIPGKIALGSQYGIYPGHPADFIVFDAHSAQEVMAELPGDRAVFHRGERVYLRHLHRTWKG
jgi:cytosine deaminase